MSENPAKDFGAIADDYSFFERHATEAREDVRAYAEELRGRLPTTGVVRMLDFGCGTGTFTERFLDELGWAPERVALTLVEPVDAVRRQAVERLASRSGTPIVESATLPAEGAGPFDLILANHVFYYVPNLRAELAKLIGSLVAGGTFVTAIAGRSNALIEFWIAAFGELGREVPYHVAEDVEGALQELGASYAKRSVAYELVFEDSEANRMRILRFLLADYLPLLPREFLVGLFDRYACDGQIEIRTASEHYVVGK
ncbi:class I SAM-dependent methyltransferase [Lacipirellula limnantheis]|uniref:Trans-aconitate 2-methyltransferase n=1 Tax=Lacipirellula limnantheis TaxID=2528024 RepID=A0A517U2Q7_9BACT|nr:methyltransferase domain-containing protein [Lacipirellula limnantheis]QDT74904.1 Trans-aconitate 2-methyltransferase [Lacipirellula limnantheis]